jgi:hypothetical protein
MSAYIPLGGSGSLVPIDRPKTAAVSERRVARRARANSARSIWFSVLLASICLEGLGRRYLPWIPATIFYFFKDAVLIFGLVRFRIHKDVSRIFGVFYRRFTPFLKMGMLWTFAELINPHQRSLVLGLLGFRAYWFWWLAPLVVASVLLDPTVRRKVVMLQAGLTIIVAMLAILQFGSPVDDVVNTYSVVNGEEMQAVEISSTGRPRVSSTFSYISGFTDFSLLVPVLLLSIGLGEKDRRTQFAALIATLLMAAALPMSGSRGPFIITMALCALVAWRAGMIFTAIGRRVIVIAVAAGFVSVFAYPDALQGIKDRFDGGDTEDRASEFFNILPPVALGRLSYPAMGIGTGMMQNYRDQFGVYDEVYSAEGEVGRYLVELGPVGYLLVWIAKFGLVVVLWKSSRVLKRAGRNAAAGSAIAYCFLGIYGSLTFDHIYAALYFVGYGFILQEVVQASLLLAARSSSSGGGLLAGTGAKAHA